MHSKPRTKVYRKTRAMFGGPLQGSLRDVGGVLGHVLEALFEENDCDVGLGCWEVRSDQSAVDLLLPAQGDMLATVSAQDSCILFPEYINVKCDTLRCAHDVVRQARTRSVSWTDDDKPVPLSNRSHVFVRVVLRKENCIANLIFVDLAGNKSLKPPQSIKRGAKLRRPPASKIEGGSGRNFWRSLGSYLKFGKSRRRRVA